jgi:hypothetical protein
LKIGRPDSSQHLKTIVESDSIDPVKEYLRDRGTRGLPHRLHFRFNYPAIEKGDPQPVILLDIVEK